jgi:hypothetical protein
MSKKKAKSKAPGPGPGLAYDPNAQGAAPRRAQPGGLREVAIVEEQNRVHEVEFDESLPPRYTELEAELNAIKQRQYGPQGTIKRNEWFDWLERQFSENNVAYSRNDKKRFEDDFFRKIIESELRIQQHAIKEEREQRAVVFYHERGLNMMAGVARNGVIWIQHDAMKEQQQLDDLRAGLGVAMNEFIRAHKPAVVEEVKFVDNPPLAEAQELAQLTAELASGGMATPFKEQHQRKIYEELIGNRIIEGMPEYQDACVEVMYISIRRLSLRKLQLEENTARRKVDFYRRIGGHAVQLTDAEQELRMFKSRAEPYERDIITFTENVRRLVASADKRRSEQKQNEYAAYVAENGRRVAEDLDRVTSPKDDLVRYVKKHFNKTNLGRSYDAWVKQGELRTFMNLKTKDWQLVASALGAVQMHSPKEIEVWVDRLSKGAAYVRRDVENAPFVFKAMGYLVGDKPSFLENWTHATHKGKPYEIHCVEPGMMWPAWNDALRDGECLPSNGHLEMNVLPYKQLTLDIVVQFLDLINQRCQFKRGSTQISVPDATRVVVDWIESDKFTLLVQRFGNDRDQHLLATWAQLNKLNHRGFVVTFGGRVMQLDPKDASRLLEVELLKPSQHQRLGSPSSGCVIC